MLALVIGLLMFISIHLIPSIAPSVRNTMSLRFGVMGWRVIHSLAALIGLYLIVLGYASARMEPIWLWYPAPWLSHITGVLMLVAFTFIGAAWAPTNAIKTAVSYPGIIGVKIWAVSHILVNGSFADLLLFGSFLAWSVVSFSGHRRRDRAAMASQNIKFDTNRDKNLMRGTVIAVVYGVSLSLLVAIWLHPMLIGVPAIIRS